MAFTNGFEYFSRAVDATMIAKPQVLRSQVDMPFISMGLVHTTKCLWALRIMGIIACSTGNDRLRFFINTFHSWAQLNNACAVEMQELDEKNGKEGNELDELYAHRFLELYGVRAVV